VVGVGETGLEGVIERDGSDEGEEVCGEPGVGFGGMVLDAGAAGAAGVAGAAGFGVGGVEPE
jgi:hypothetical protein